MSQSTEKFIPPEYIPRIEKFLDKLADREIEDTEFIRFIEALIRPAVASSIEDAELKAALERQIKSLLGVKVWLNAKGQNHIVIEITQLPELLKLYPSTEEEVKRLGLPGVTYDPAILKEALAGKFNPLLALASRKIRIVGLPALIAMGSPIISAFKPFKDKGEIREKLRWEILAALDKCLGESGC